MNKLKKLFLIGLVWILSFILFMNTSVAQTNLEVSGIMYSGKEGSSAIVNNKIVKVGDKIGEAEVIEITENSVKFKEGEKIFSKGLTGGSNSSASKPGYNPSPLSSKPFASKIYENCKWGTPFNELKEQLIAKNKNR